MPYTLSDDQKTLTTPSGEQWTLTKLLEGRGQSGFAGFYQDPAGKVYLVKKDDPGTCLSEATATNTFVPTSHQRSVNCATIGSLGEDLLTIQPLVAVSQEERENGIKAVGLDVFVYGRKRRPKTWFSEESTHTQDIKDKLSEFSPHAKRDLAASLFASTALGDESLHLGQFMAITSKTEHVIRVVRIDFGARERFTQERANKHDFSPVNTSSTYSKSGQFGKDYISYLVNSDNKIRALYLTLWSKADVNDIVTPIIEKFRSELEALPQDMQKVALSKFLKQFNKKASIPFCLDLSLNFKDQKEQFFDVYQSAVELRCTSMKVKAREEIQKVIFALPMNHQDRNILTQFLMGNESSRDLLTEVKRIQVNLPDGHEQTDILTHMIDSRIEWHNSESGLQSQNTSTRILSTLRHSGISDRDTVTSYDEGYTSDESVSDSDPRLSFESTSSSNPTDEEQEEQGTLPKSPGP